MDLEETRLSEGLGRALTRAKYVRNMLQMQVVSGFRACNGDKSPSQMQDRAGVGGVAVISTSGAL